MKLHLYCDISIPKVPYPVNESDIMVILKKRNILAILDDNLVIFT